MNFTQQIPPPIGNHPVLFSSKLASSGSADFLNQELFHEVAFFGNVVVLRIAGGMQQGQSGKLLKTVGRHDQGRGREVVG